MSKSFRTIRRKEGKNINEEEMIDILQKESPIWTNPLKLKYGSIELQNWRSKTPMGFAYAFYEANH